MNKESRILVTGAGGMVGSALVRHLQVSHDNVIAHRRKDCDLEDRQRTKAYFANLKPEYVFHLASKVGGIRANMEDPAGFLQNNLLSQIHTIESCLAVNVKKLLFLGSSCIYPRECPQPMKEESLLSGKLEPTNEGYALAKIAGLKLVQYYSQQFGMNAVCPMPCNIYGVGDNFDLEYSHVLSALVRRFVEAKREGVSEIILWGTGRARREFIHLDDAIKGIVFMMKEVNTAEIINLGSGIDYSISELAGKVAEQVGYKGNILWDSSKPDGMMKKCLDVSKLNNLGFKAEVGLELGIRDVIEDFEKRYPV